MNRWSATASDDAAAPTAPAGPRPSGRGGWARAQAASAGFATPLERPATLPSAAKPDPRRTLNLETAPTRIDLAIECLLVALLAFMPAALGVVAHWSEMVVVCTAAAIALCLAAKTFFHRNTEGRRVDWSWSYVPIVLFIALAVAQVVPLPAVVVRAVSPATVELKTRLLADAPDAALAKMPLSFYPQGALRELRLVLVAVVLFVAVINTFQRTAQVKRLLMAIAAIGGAYAVLALLQDVTAADKIYWTIPTFGGARSGPFINHNHYGQFINLSIGAAVALLLVRLREEFPRRVRPLQMLDRLRDPELRGIWWLAGVVIVGAATLFLSLSRGGMVAMLAATAFSAIVLALRRGLGGVGWLLSLLGLFVFIALLYGGFDAVADRLATLHQADDPTAGRTQIYKDVAVSWRKFPVAGMGLGSWEVTYPMFDRSKIAAIAEYADSDYAQALHEIGAVGLGLALLFAALIWGSYARATAAAKVPLCAAAFRLGYGLLAVMVQSATDYGQHMPAIAGLTAVTCGLLVCLGKRAKAAARSEQAHVARSAGETVADLASDAPDGARGRGRGVLALPGVLGRLAVPGALLVAMAWALLGVNDARVAEGHWDRAQSLAADLEADGWEGSNADYAALLLDADAAAKLQPKNVHYQYWLNAYRWRSISRATDPDTGEMLVTELSLGAARRIVDELHAARALCPTFGPLPSLAGQLELLMLDRSRDGAVHVRLGRELSPNDPAAVFAAALVDVSEKQWDASLDKFRHCLALNPNSITDVLGAYVGAGRADLALAAADGSAVGLHRLAALIKGDEGRADIVKEAEDKFLALMATEEEQEKSNGWLLSEAANIYRDRDDRPTAIAYYQKAVSKNYGNAAWRYELAKCLAAEGRNDEAKREARLVLRLKPQWVGAKRLIENLGVGKPARSARARLEAAPDSAPASAEAPPEVPADAPFADVAPRSVESGQTGNGERE